MQQCGRLYDAAMNLAVEAIGMAADMNRILNDLYYGVSDKTPLEEYAEELEENVPDGEFEEAEAELPEAELEEEEAEEE